jgi:TIR domain-containing protein
MTVDPHSFTIILQSQQAGSPTITCCGFPQLAAVQPTRVLVVADAVAAARRDDLVGVLATQFGLLAAGAQDCYGPGGFGCWATHEPGVRNLLVVVASDQAPSADLSQLATDWRSQGFETLGVFRADLNPDNVLPPAMQAQHAPSWQADVREVAGEIVDSVVLGIEDRRVFISYSHADGTPTAERLFDLLSKLRFDVFLDRFRLDPGVDFIERIADELIDKAMIVVVETPHAVSSSWVRQEVATAVDRRLGLAAIHLQPGPVIGEIDEVARCRHNNDGVITQFVLDQHRTQLRQRREALLDSVWQSLGRAVNQAVLGPGQIRPTANGFQVDSPARSYVLTVCPRPADLHRFRLAKEAATAGDAVVIHPQPQRVDRRRDVAWLSEATGMPEVDEGLFDAAADQLVAGTL